MSGGMKHPASKTPRGPAKGRACFPTKAHRSGGCLGSLKHAVGDSNSEIPWRYGFRRAGSADEKMSRRLLLCDASEKRQNNFESTLITALTFTLAPPWVLGKRFLCWVATVLRWLSHKCCREMVRSDKFDKEFDNVIESWVTWVSRTVCPGDPPRVES